ncbi:MAG: NUDIX domain-containing protein [Candidatus Saccharimonadales bacterium]
MSEDLFHLGVKALITNGQGELLLLKVNPAELSGSNKQTSDYWDLAGGRINRGASVEETLAREVEEELGASDLTVIRPVGMVLSNIRIPLKDGSDVGLVLSVYECKLPEENAFILSREHLAHQWFTPPEAAKRLQIKYPKEFCKLVAAL